MSLSKSELPDCDPEIFQNGQSIAMIGEMDKNDVEALVKAVAKTSGQKVDWHYIGGRAVIFYIGDRSLVQKAFATHDEMYVMGMLKSYRKFNFRTGLDGIPPLHWLG